MTREGSIRTGNRPVTYLEVGDPGGPLVLHNHGGPSSRLEAELFDSSAKANGVRFVCADRPGMGGSDPQPGRTFEGWTDDLLLLADSLGAHRFAVTGWSEGGPWALAAAAYLDPARLVHVACIADREVLADEDVLGLFLGASRECFLHGADGLVVDATMLYEAWPFDMTSVTRPVHFWQGSDDALVPEIINKTVAEKTPGALWHPIDAGGHFIAVSHADDILALVANDLAPESN
ncbi:alpha/beta fold hydrolase [Rhodococcus sp. PvR099]|uniref:alpha/beta fold hydrolase n=1 Tax=Rhodococcus sp. PvR099 TaxID=2806602 RepID=UPI001AE6BCFE|nr:alpha/beta hydrolase [Rhodococcus sp. PvR099]MBP1158354.1 pimeloyl-ACP methyl ester carboxylesterase [Rhodococcus sp. PvR099]